MTWCKYQDGAGLNHDMLSAPNTILMDPNKTHVCHVMFFSIEFQHMKHFFESTEAISNKLH